MKRQKKKEKLSNEFDHLAPVKLKYFKYSKINVGTDVVHKLINKHFVKSYFVASFLNHVHRQGRIYE